METRALHMSGLGSDGMFNLEQPEEALAFMRFLQSVSTIASRQVRSAQWSAQLLVEPQCFWRADADLQELYERVDTWRREVFDWRSV